MTLEVTGVRMFPLLVDGLTLSVLVPPCFFLKQEAVEIHKPGELSVVSTWSWHLRWHLFLLLDANWYTVYLSKLIYLFL